MTEKRVYILLTDTGSFLTNLIKLYTKKPYNHASLSFDTELSEVYSFGRKKACNPFNGGFVKEDVKQGLFKEADCSIYSLSITDVQLQKMKVYIKEMEEQKESYRYNFLGLFGFLFKKPIKRKRALFCSQFVASVLKDCNIIDFEKPLSLIAPHDFQEIPRLNPVFQGKLKDYCQQAEVNDWYDPIHCIPFEI